MGGGFGVLKLQREARTNYLRDGNGRLLGKQFANVLTFLFAATPLVG